MEEFSLNDIANDLLIINKQTIDILFSLDNGADCVALYVFYYKTSKWQKTSSIKATDEYVKKSLKWGIDRIKKAKNILKDNGLIKVTKKTDEKGIIIGWFVELSYMIENHIHNTQNPQVAESTSGFQETNACNNIDIYNNKNKVLNDNNINAKENIIKEIFDFWNSKNISNHIKLNEDRKKAISKRLKEYSVDEIKLAINHYEIILHDKDSFWNYTWSLEDFLNRKNGFTTFLDDGSNWVSYSKGNKKTNSPYKSNQEISRETAYPEYDNLNYY